MATNQLEAEALQSAVKPRDFQVRSRSNRAKASSLIPDWMVPGDAPMPWRVDGRTVEIFRRTEVADLRELVSLRCGFDPDQFLEPVSFEKALAAWRTQADQAEPSIQVFIDCLDRAEEAVRSGELQILGIRIWLCLRRQSRPDSSSAISVVMSAPKFFDCSYSCCGSSVRHLVFIGMAKDLARWPGGSS